MGTGQFNAMGKPAPYGLASQPGGDRDTPRHFIMIELG